MPFPPRSPHRRRAALEEAIDPGEQIHGEYAVTLAGKPAAAAVTSFCLWVVPLDRNRATMVAPAISAIDSVEQRQTRRRVQLTLTTPGSVIELTARPHVAERLVHKVLTHRLYQGRAPGER